VARRKIPIEHYRKVARDVSAVAPQLKPLIGKTNYTKSERAKLIRYEDKYHHATGGTQRLLPLTEKQISQLDKQSRKLLAPGFNAVIDRNLGRNPKPVVKNGQIYIRDNGRHIHIVPANAGDPDRFLDFGESLFKGGRKNVWVRFKNGRSNSSFRDSQALANFIVMLYEKYQPDWAEEGYEVDDIVEGFEVFEQPGKQQSRPKKKARKTPTKKAPRKAPTRKPAKRKAPARRRAQRPSVDISRVVQQRFTTTAAEKRQRKATADLLKAARAATRASTSGATKARKQSAKAQAAAKQIPKSRGKPRGTSKKNRRR
jgi:hypothetical protein